MRAQPSTPELSAWVFWFSGTESEYALDRIMSLAQQNRKTQVVERGRGQVTFSLEIDLRNARPGDRIMVRGSARVGDPENPPVATRSLSLVDYTVGS